MTPRKQSEIYDKRDEILARIDERTMAIPRIDSHLLKLNGNVTDAINKAMIADSKADIACDGLTNLRKDMNEGLKTVNSRQWKLMWGLLGFSGTIIIYLIFEVWLDWI